MLFILGIIIFAIPAIGVGAMFMDALDDARFYKEFDIR